MEDSAGAPEVGAGLVPDLLPAGTSGDEEGLERIWTVPNLLSLLRLALLATFAVLTLSARSYSAAASALAVAGITDFLDGWVARRFHQVTTLGKVLDPTVDRLFLGTSVAVILASGAVPVWLSVVVLVREGLVGASAVALAALGARRIDVRFVGKAGTFGLMVCFPLLLLGHQPGEWARWVRVVGYAGLVPSLALSWAAAAAYVPAARRALAEGRGGRRGTGG